MKYTILFRVAMEQFVIAMTLMVAMELDRCWTGGLQIVDKLK